MLERVPVDLGFERSERVARWSVVTGKPPKEQSLVRCYAALLLLKIPVNLDAAVPDGMSRRTTTADATSNEMQCECKEEEKRVYARCR